LNEGAAITAVHDWVRAVAGGCSKGLSSEFCEVFYIDEKRRLALLKIFLDVLNRLRRALRFVKRVKGFQSKPFTTARAKSSS
jgi:hypothetical protein